MTAPLIFGDVPRDEVRRLHASGRTDVLWVGGNVPKPLIAALIVQYEIVRVPREVSVLSAAAPTARALLIEVNPDDTDLAWTKPLINVALNHGLLVVFTAPDVEGEEREPARHHCYTTTRPLVEPGRVCACFNDWTTIASSISHHDPKGGCNRYLELGSDSTLSGDAETLIRRAFYDFETLSLELVQGGKSGAAVWIARLGVRDRHHRAAPFLVKWNGLEKMRREWSNVTQYATNTVSFRLTPPLHVSRCIEGSDSALLVFDFIDHATPFASAIQTYPAGQLIGSLFDHTLAGCLTVAADQTSEIVKEYESNGLLKWVEDLREIAARAVTMDNSLPSCDELAAQLRGFGELPHRTATVHGDMHVLNLLVASGSSDVLLIDFGKIMSNTSVIADAACLEVSLTFPTEEARTQLRRRAPSLDESWIAAAYTFPLDPHSVPPRHDKERWLTDAVRAIRGAARQHEPSAASYAIAIIVYLVRYASFPNNGAVVEDRILAYRIACHLSAQLADSLNVGCTS